MQISDLLGLIAERLDSSPSVESASVEANDHDARGKYVEVTAKDGAEFCVWVEESW